MKKAKMMKEKKEDGDRLTTWVLILFVVLMVPDSVPVQEIMRGKSDQELEKK